jgi:hypothetical protein
MYRVTTAIEELFKGASLKFFEEPVHFEAALLPLLPMTLFCIK